MIDMMSMYAFIRYRNLHIFQSLKNCVFGERQMEQNSKFNHGCKLSRSVTHERTSFQISGGRQDNLIIVFDNN
jgi:hypothetical protein